MSDYNSFIANYKKRYEQDDEEEKKQASTQDTYQEPTKVESSDYNTFVTNYQARFKQDETEQVEVQKESSKPSYQEPEAQQPTEQKNIWEKIRDTFQKLTKLTQSSDDGTYSDVDKEADRLMKESTMKEVPTSEVLKRYQEDPVGYLVNRPYYSSKDKYLTDDKDLSTKDVMEKKLVAYGDYYNSLDEVGKAKLTNPVEGLSDDSYAYIKLNTDNILKETEIEIQTLYSQLETAEGKDKRQIKTYLKDLEEQKKDLEYIQKGVIENKGFIEGIKEGFTDVRNIPVVGSVIRADEAIGTLRAWRKYENGEDLNTREAMLVNRLKKAEIESISEDKNIGYGIASGVATSLSLIVEVALALAIPTPVDGEIALATRGASGIGKVALAGGKLLWSAGKITATTGVPKIVESTATYQAPEMAFDWQDNDFEKIGEGDEFSDALLKSIAKEYGNNLIEVGLGSALDASSTAVQKGIANLVGKEIQATSKNQVITFLRTKGGWNGFLGEFAEEIAQKYYEEGVIDNKEVTFTEEELITIAGSVLLLQGMGEVVGQFGVDQEGQREQIEAEAEANIRATIQEADRRNTEEVGVPPEVPPVDDGRAMFEGDLEQVKEQVDTVAEPVQEVEILKGDDGTEYSKAQVDNVLRELSAVLDVDARKKVVSKVEGSENANYGTQDYLFGVEGMVIPEFIPEELRSRTIVQKAYDAFLNDTVPQEGTKVWQVYQAILEESTGREGLEIQKPEVTPARETSTEEAPVIQEKNASEFTENDRVQIVKVLDDKKMKYDKEAPTHMLNGIVVASTKSNVQIREMAKDVMRVEVLRGDSLDSFKEMGSTLPSFSGDFRIGGYIDGKRVGNDTVVMEMADGRIVKFKKKELYDEIKKESKETKPPKTQKEQVKEEAIPRELEDLAIEAQGMTGYDFNKEYGYLFTTIGDGDTTYQYYKGSVEDFYRTAQTFKKPTPDNIQMELDELTDADLPFRRGSDGNQYLDDSKLNSMALDEMKRVSREIFGDENVRVMAQILTPDRQQAMGRYINSWIEIRRGSVDKGSTFYHEAVHKALEIFLTPDERLKILSAVKSYVGEDVLKKDWSKRTTSEKMRLASYWSNALESYQLNLPTVRKAGVGAEEIARKSVEWKGKENLLNSYAESVGIKPENLYGSSVQYVDTNTGERVIYLVDGEMDAVHAQALIDASAFGMAGEQIDGKTYHITALKPSDFENAFTIIEGKFDPRSLPYSKDASQRSKQREYRNQFGITKNAEGMYRGASVEGLSTNAVAEEWLAENIIDYVNGTSTFVGRLKRMVDVFVDRWFRGVDGKVAIESFYKDLLSGKLLVNQQKQENQRIKEFNKILESIQGSGMRTDEAFRKDIINPEYRYDKRKRFRKQIGGVLQPLVTLHNISFEKLLLAEEEGLLPAPSLAVTKPENPQSGFGEITLVGGRDIVDPEVNYDNRLYSHDVYSPRVPAPEYNIDKKEWQKFYYNEDVDSTFKEVDDYLYNFQDAIQHSDAKSELEDEARRSWGMKALYLKEKKVKVPIIYKPVAFKFSEYLDTKAFKENKEFFLRELDPDDIENINKKKEIFKQMVMEYVKSNSRLNTKYMKEVYAKEVIENYTAENKHFWDMYGMNNGVRKLEKNKGEEVDTYETRDAISRKIMEIDKTEKKFEDWTKEYFASVFSDPYIKIGGKKVPYTAENKVRAMFGKGLKGQEGSIFGGVNLIKARGAKKYSSIEQAKRDSYGRLISEQEYDKVTSKQYDEFSKRVVKLNKYNKYYDGEHEFDYGSSINNNLEYAMADYARGSKSWSSFMSAFRRNGYELPEKVAEETKKWADSIFSDPVPYLEAKPRRAVALSEFTGAILPVSYKGGKAEMILRENGVDRIVYRDDTGRSDVLEEKAKLLNESFNDVKYRMTDASNEEAYIDEINNVVKVKLPELVELAENLGADVQVKGKLGKALGNFKPLEGTDSRIRLLRELFEPKGDVVVDSVTGEETMLKETPEQIRERIDMVEKVLAHEVGHLVDWFGGEGNMTLKRGNLLGRMANLGKYMEVDFKGYNNKEIRKELKALTQIWNPFDETSVPKKYKSYRYSAKELYADSLSVLFNDPALMKEVAPNFYQGFLEFVARKSEVQSELFATWDMIKEGQEIARRFENMDAGFEEARQKRMNIDQKKEAYKKQREWQNVITKLKYGFSDMYAPYMDKLRKRYRDGGIALSKLEQSEQAMHNLSYIGDEVAMYAQDVQKEFFEPISEAGISVNDVGKILILERNLGDRLDLANPQGLVYDYAQETYDKLKSEMNPAQWVILQEKLRWWRDHNFKLVEKAYKAGVYSEKFFNEIAQVNKNTYTPFAVIKYIDDNYVTAGIIQAKGTVKKVENPINTQMLKSMSIIRATVTNLAKKDIVDTMKDTFSDEIIKAKAVRGSDGKFVRWEVNKDAEFKGMDIIELKEDGKRAGYYVDEYIKEMFESPVSLTSMGAIKIFTTPFRIFNRIFKPAVTTFKPSFQFYSNPIRDVKRSLKNLSALSAFFDNGNEGVVLRTGKVYGAFMKEWMNSLKQSWDFVGGNMDAVTNKMLELHAISNQLKYEDIDIGTNEVHFDAIKNKVVYKSKVNWADTVIDFSGKIPVINKTLYPLAKLYQRLGQTLEVNSKIAGFKYLEPKVGEQRASLYTRKYVGTPNFMQKGKFTPVMNELVVFSNVQIQALTSEIEISTSPKTASGYWLSMFINAVVPKLIMLAGATLLKVPIPDPDDEDKTIWVNPFDYMSEYDKSNYITIPTGYDIKTKKFLYLRIPMDDSEVIIGNAVWKMGTYLQGKGMKIEQLGAVLTGMIPLVSGENPFTQLTEGWMDYAQGRNPYDDFRGRPAIYVKDWEEGGLVRFREMMKWSSNTLGVTNFTTYDRELDTSFEKILQAPVLERMFRLSDYGITEREQWEEDMGKKEKKGELKSILQDYYAQPSDKKILELQDKYVMAVKGEEPKEGWAGVEKAEVTRLKQEFKKEILLNSGDDKFVKVAKMTANDEKLEYIEKQRDSMSKDEYADYLAQLVKYEVIKGELFATYAHDKNLTDSQVYEVVKQSIPVLSPDGNNTLLWELRKFDAISNESLFKLRQSGLLTSMGYGKYIELNSRSYQDRYEKDEPKTEKKLF